MCARGPTRVPCNMGWMWTVMATGSNSKWRPGAIRKPIKEIMSWFLKDFPVDTLPVSRYASLRCKTKKNQELSVKEETQKPILHILKKKNEYIITMRPLKTKTALRENENPYLDMKPLMFRILKNPDKIFLNNLKQKLKDLGYSPCICHKPISQCVCHSYRDKMEIVNFVEYECRKNCTPNCKDTVVMSNISESESEIDFAVTPPISRLKPENRNKPNFAHFGTQYDIEDWSLKPKMPIYSAQCKLRPQKTDPLNCGVFLHKCAQNIQPPILIPTIEKPKKTTDKKGKKKGKGKGKVKGKCKGKGRKK